MKKPIKIIKFLHIETKKDNETVDWNGKQIEEVFVRIPYWLYRAYRKPHRVKVEISDEKLCFNDIRKQETDDAVYFKKNWLRKIIKMRKLNNNYIKKKVIK